MNTLIAGHKVQGLFSTGHILPKASFSRRISVFHSLGFRALNPNSLFNQGSGGRGPETSGRGPDFNQVSDNLMQVWSLGTTLYFHFMN